MKRLLDWAYLIVIVIALASATVVIAGFQVKRQICELSVGGCYFKEKDGQLGVVEINSHEKWSASVPNIINTKGRYIAADEKGRIVLSNGIEAGHVVSWAFDFTERWEPKTPAGRDYGRLKEGESGFAFTMKLTKGPFKDLYLAVDPVPDNLPRPEWRPLRLVADPKQAATLRYRDTEYEVGHK